MDLLEKMPRTKEELKNVSGFGEVKVNKYGENILKIVNERDLFNSQIPIQ